MSQHNTTLACIASKQAILEEALHLIAQRDWKIIPCKPDKSPHHHPHDLPHGVKNATTDANLITRWCTRWPDALIGVACEDFFVLDIDTKGNANGFDTLRALEAEHGPLPATLTVTTPSGGEHRYFRHVEGLVGKAHQCGSGLDIRTTGNYVIVPPSIIEGVGSYEFKGNRLLAVETAPDWLIELARTGTVKQRADSSIPDGRRNDGLTSIAGSLRRRGLSYDDMLPVLLRINAERCDPPLPDKDVERITKSIASKPMGEVAGHALTEFGNAMRLIEQFGDKLRYCHKWGCWYIWDGRRWLEDSTGAPVEFTKRAVKSIYDEEFALLRAGQTDEARKVGTWAYKSQSRRNVENSLWLARGELPITPGELNMNDWLLNVENGTLDLKTFELHEHRPADRITKLTPVTYDPLAECPRWQTFLEEIYAGDAELIAFMQRAVGYALTGSTREQVFLLLHGEGQNGKSTLLEALLALLGEYARPTEFRTLLHRENDNGVRNDIAALVSLRLVTAVEAEDGKRLNETMIKTLTGGDTITARRLYQEFFDFRPKFKLFLAANQQPEIRGLDKAIWRRVLLVPHDVIIPDDKVDRNLPALLKSELPGILNWALTGLREWQKLGLAPPERIIAATQLYRDDQNRLARFLDDECDVNVPSTTCEATGALYERYREWCQRNAEQPVYEKSFGKLLEGLGFKRGPSRIMVHGEKKTVRFGIKLKMAQDDIPF